METDGILTHFQARARGYLLRTSVRCAQEDYEDIVREIDGGLAHLEWVKKAVYFPHFTDTQGPLPLLSSPVQSPEAEPVFFSESPAGGQEEDVPEKIVAERDVLLSQPEDSFDHSLHRDDSTTVWSSGQTDMDSSHSHRGLRRYCLTTDVPRTPQALRLHRNTLCMELVWLQQAIDSRKKYLSLKNTLS